MDTQRGCISVRLAMSLDGYTADHDGGYGWTEPVPSPELDTEHQLPFDRFLTTVDRVVTGRRCHEQGQAADYVDLGKPVLVATSSRPALPPLRRWTACPLLPRRRRRRRSQRRRRARASGRWAPAVPGEHPHLDLRLVDHTVSEGKVRLVYHRR